jgi:type I restriction enzyme M protein
MKAGNEVIRLQKEGQGKNKGKKKDVVGLAGLEGRLIPTSLIIKTYFETEQNALDALQSELEQAGVEMEELKEEHGGDEELLESVVNDTGNITKGDLKARIKEIKDDNEFAEELALLKKYSELLEKETEYKVKIKTAENDLEKKVIAKYPTLSIQEIKTLVVEHKWMNELQTRIMSEVDRTSQTLAGRIKELAERYSETLLSIEKETQKLTAKVDEHLAQMGFKV